MVKPRASEPVLQRTVFPMTPASSLKRKGRGPMPPILKHVKVELNIRQCKVLQRRKNEHYPRLSVVYYNGVTTGAYSIDICSRERTLELEEIESLIFSSKSKYRNVALQFVRGILLKRYDEFKGAVEGIAQSEEEFILVDSLLDIPFSFMKDGHRYVPNPNLPPLPAGFELNSATSSPYRGFAYFSHILGWAFVRLEHLQYYPSLYLQYFFHFIVGSKPCFQVRSNAFFFNALYNVLIRRNFPNPESMLLPEDDQPRVTQELFTEVKEEPADEPPLHKSKSFASGSSSKPRVKLKPDGSVDV